jgi:hypothetical protein
MNRRPSRSETVVASGSSVPPTPNSGGHMDALRTACGRRESLRVEFTGAEIAFLRNEFTPRFGTEPRIGDGIMLRSWKSGPSRGQPRLPGAIQSMMSRGLVEVTQLPRGQNPLNSQLFRAHFTSEGLVALRDALQSRKSFDPDRFGHLIAELRESHQRVT